MTDQILAPLNEAQRRAVSAEKDGMLVLAGAGSGKTRVLVHRIAWLVQAVGISPWSILAVTFTNKAANEMKSRIEELLAAPVGGMWLGTFHGLANRLLRAHWQEAKLPQQFQILDSDDQLRLVKRCLRDLQIDDSRWPPRQAQGYINSRKDEGLRPKHIDPGQDIWQRQMHAIYSEYQQRCERNGVIDFAELLLRAFELLRDNEGLLRHYRDRFSYMLVDEFQDTNDIQYAWLRLLAGDQIQPFVVGDDDQSIYGWRGAKIENIRRFQKDFPASGLVRLEQNYRSSGNILNAANALIANNPERMGKNLWTDDGEGELISLYAAFNEVDEARFVVERIRQFVDNGHRRDEAAILYRSNAQSRVLEEALIQAQMPYRVYGGLRFFERAEIKDTLAYLRLLLTPTDDASFERVVNLPPRGIGARTLDQLRVLAREQAIPMHEAASRIIAANGLTARAGNALQGFIGLLQDLRSRMTQITLTDLTEAVISKVGLPDYYRSRKDGKGEDRVENLEELVNATRSFEYQQEDDEDSGLAGFLTHAALEAGEAQGDAYEDCVQLMTLHSAKGLEFPMVFLVGVEEGLFPHRMSVDEAGRLQEERRLCYVGMTRAMQKLYLCHAESRRLHGSESYPMPSRFLREIPQELIQEERARPQISRPVYNHTATPAHDSAYRLGQRVSHSKFGEGVVLNTEGSGAQARVQVNFASAGSKWLVISYAKLTVLY
ncbi:MAG: DNA helicase II [gamma proteobacterium symbiont of Bathyaustriella thionipta]|nr:DNA helicase II [gamma proteobacterium symbiont of Bathyaustriella thionipta]